MGRAAKSRSYFLITICKEVGKAVFASSQTIYWLFLAKKVLKFRQIWTNGSKHSELVATLCLSYLYSVVLLKWPFSIILSVFMLQKNPSQVSLRRMRYFFLDLLDGLSVILAMKEWATFHNYSPMMCNAPVPFQIPSVANMQGLEVTYTWYVSRIRKEQLRRRQRRMFFIS